MSRKAWTSMAMALMMAVSLCACGGQESNAGKEPVGNVPGGASGNVSQESEYDQEDVYQGEEESSDEMFETEDIMETEDAWSSLTTEQRNMLDQYVYLASILDDYASNPTNYGHNLTEELEKLYQRLVELEPMDTIPEDVVQSILADRYDFDGKVDRQGLLSRFIVLEDVPVYQTVTTSEHSGKTSTKTKLCWNYTEDGEMSWENPTNNDHLLYNSLLGYDIQREYDGNGRLAKTLYYERGALKYTVIYTYDAAGHLVLERRETAGQESNGQEFEITCDDQGRVIKAHWNDFWDNTITYEYNADGNLVKAALVQSYNGENHTDVEYVYDANGHLDAATLTYWTTGFSNRDTTEQVNTIDYVCDDQGRVISSTMTVGHVYYTSGDNAGSVAQEQKNATVVIETIYGNYYFLK